MFTSSYKGRIVSKGCLLFKINVSKEGAIEKETNTGPTLNDRKIKITERERGNMKNPQKQGCTTFIWIHTKDRIQKELTYKQIKAN